MATVFTAYALAVNDRERLEQLGHEDLPAPEWALIAPLAYLVLRARRTQRDSWDALGPMWTNVGNLAAIPAIFILIQLWGSAAMTIGR